MESGKRKNAEGNIYQVKSTIRKIGGRTAGNQDLKSERKDKIFILELLIDAGFISQCDKNRFQVMTGFGNFKAGDIKKLRDN